MINLNEVKDLMARIDEDYRRFRKNVNEEIDINDEYTKKIIKDRDEYFKEAYGTDIKLYHRAGMHADMPFIEVIRSICKHGLSTKHSNDGDGIGNCIWFSSDYRDYCERDGFILSIELNGENSVRFKLHYDGHNAYAYKDIPFEYLTIEKIPIVKGPRWFLFNDDDFYETTEAQECLISGAKTWSDVGDVIMFIDAWDYFGIEYDLEEIKKYPIKIETLGLPKK